MNIMFILIPAVWTITIIGCILYVINNKKFGVTIIDLNVRIDASPSLVWSKGKKASRVIAISCLVIMWVMFLYIRNAGIDAKPSKWLVLLPTLASVIFFFAGYSATLVSNYITIRLEEFNSWRNQGLIKQVGERNFVDVNGDKLLHSFDNKVWLK